MERTNKAMYLHIRSYLEGQQAISRKAVAADAGLSQSTLSRMLTGKRRITIEEYERLCRAMAVDPAAFLSTHGKERET